MRLVRVLVLGRRWDLTCYTHRGIWTRKYRFHVNAMLAWYYYKWKDWFQFNSHAYTLDLITTRKFKWRIRFKNYTPDSARESVVQTIGRP